MKTKTIELYSFDELSEEAKKKAIENLYDINVDYEWWDSIYQDFETMLSYFGVDMDHKKTHFTLSYSQGDGCGFSSSHYIDVAKLVDCVVGEKWREHAPKQEFDFYKVDNKVLRALKLLKAGLIDFPLMVNESNRGTAISVTCEWSLVHETYKCADYKNTEALIESLFDFCEDVLKELNDAFFKMLRENCEYLMSEEAIIETIKANEYTFTSSGKLEN